MKHRHVTDTRQEQFELGLKTCWRPADTQEHQTKPTPSILLVTNHTFSQTYILNHVTTKPKKFNTRISKLNFGITLTTSFNLQHPHSSHFYASHTHMFCLNRSMITVLLLTPLHSSVQVTLGK